MQLKIECQQDIKKINNKILAIKVQQLKFQSYRKKFNSEDDLVVKKNEKFSNYLFLFFDIFYL